MIIRWLPQAREDLFKAHRYIARHDASAAKRVVNRTTTLVETQLLFSPDSGRIGRVVNTRELVIPRTPLIVVYRVVDAEIQVLSIRHQARLWPKNF